MASPEKVEVLYDDQCPVCRGYCTKVELKGDKKLDLIDARKGGKLLDEATSLGLDIDEGMIVKVDGKLHYGSEAMRELVKLKKAGLLERFFFGGKRRAAVSYAVSKGARNVLLKILRIPKIGNLD